jgi:peptidoglycan/xylan/chitin deacetylase (PgdA/CDA1 family)
MDWGMVSSLYKKGFEIGSHSYSHRHLTTLEDKELSEEIVDSKKIGGKGNSG